MTIALRTRFEFSITLPSETSAQNSVSSMASASKDGSMRDHDFGIKRLHQEVGEPFAQQVAAQHFLTRLIGTPNDVSFVDQEDAVQRRVENPFNLGQKVTPPRGLG